MKHAVQFFLMIIFACTAHAVQMSYNLPKEGVVEPPVETFKDTKQNFRYFAGRVTDKDDRERIYKVQVENNNSKFFRAGDMIYFKVGNKDDRQFCKGYVRHVEDFFFSIYVDSLAPCFGEDQYFRRGTVLNFSAKILAERVYEADKFRQMLIIRKENFMQQLNDINHFLWSFEQQKIKTAASFDEKINQLQRQKRLALDELVHEKQEKIVVQRELMKRLNEIDDSMKFYRVERQELLSDRWNTDQDNGLPFINRPQEMKNQ